MAEYIDQVWKAETRRGRRPIDQDAVEERRRKIAALQEIWDEGTVEDLKAAMRVYGLSEMSPGWIEALQLWNAERGRR